LVPETPEAPPSGRSGRAAAWLPFLAASLAAAGATAAVLAAGRRAAASGQRVLSVLDPLFLGFRERAFPLLELIWKNRTAIGVAVTAAALALAVLALRKGLRSGAPVALGASAAAVATWGQLLLVAGRGLTGWTLYGVAVALAVAAGALAPLASLPGVPALPRPDEPPGTDDRRTVPPDRGESALFLALFLLALASRAWALNQLPSSFDAEMISTQTESRTAWGLAEFVRTEFVGTSNGLVTPLTNRAVYALFGVSITAMRVTALLWGLLGVGLFWALARRLLGGRWGPAAATLLFVAAPEQLFWSRSEVSIFSPMAAIGLLFAHAGLSMTRRFRAAPVILLALLTPVCRFFYTAAFVFVAYPVLLAGHAVLFVRGAARRALASLPVLLAGIGLWIVSVSAAVAIVSGHFAFVHPARVRGEEAWRAGLPAEAAAAVVAKAQAARLLGNLASVAEGLTVHEKYSTHWTQRAYVSEAHSPTIGMGLAVLAALGLGWLLGQPRERRSALLLLWFGLGLLPGCLSDEPDARRNAVMFTPLLLAAGLFVVAFVRLARARTGRAGGCLATLSGGLCILGVAAAGFASHFLLAVRPLVADGQIRFAAPLFTKSDTVLHDLYYREGKTIAFGQLDRLLSPSGPCYQYIERDGLLRAALAPKCDFHEEVFGLTLPPEAIAARRAAAAPRRIGYLLSDKPPGLRLLALLRAIHPTARVAEGPFKAIGESLFTIETDRADLEEALRPEVAAGVVRGGLLVPRDGWWRVRAPADCAGARLTVGTDGWNGGDERPLLSGVHPFSLVRPAACAGPVRLVLDDARSGESLEPLLVAPRVAVLPEARAPDAVSVPGWSGASRLAEFEAPVSDLAAGRSGRVCALTRRDDVWEIVCVDAEGRETGRTRADLPRYLSPGSIDLAPDGSVLVSAWNVVEVYDPALHQRARWELPEDVLAMRMALFPDGRVALLTSRGALEVFSPDGKPEGSFNSWSGGAGKFETAVGLAVGPDGFLAVAQSSGEIHLFRLPPSGFPPEFVRTLRPELADDPSADDLRGIAFVGPGRILVPYSPERPPLLLDLEGRRLMAATSGADLLSQGPKSPFRFVATPAALFTVDRSEPVLWRLGFRDRR
jgi:hypothetical protein